MAEDKASAAWRGIFESHPSILSDIENSGTASVEAKLIKEFREPRLMCKHDSLEGVPAPLKERGLNVIADSRSSYQIGDFDVFAPFPLVGKKKPIYKELPYYESLTVNKITSESNAINALLLSGILDDFLGEEGTVETFNGRMGAGRFDFNIDRYDGRGSVRIKADNPQLEIDGGFENDESVIIMEAKNVRHADFNVRQLYYPYRKYLNIVTKPIRLVFSQYSEMNYVLYEYRFADSLNFSSIELVRCQRYTLSDDRITADDIWRVWSESDVLYSDDRNLSKIPFPQADKFDRVLALFDWLADKPEGESTENIVSFMGTVERQAAYYPSAGEYIGLFDRETRGRTKLSVRGEYLALVSYNERILGIVGMLFEHAIFKKLYGRIVLSGSMPGKDEVVEVMLSYNVCSPGSTVERRASTVLSWLRWIVSLCEDDE